jgi:PAS domain-containing protein
LYNWVVSKPKDLILIVAREFASRLATAVMVTDAEGNLVYYNPPAERLLGRSFAETGEIPIDEWAAMVTSEALDGSPMPAEEIPIWIALHDRRPAQLEFARTIEGVRREISSTAFPVLSSEGVLVGVVSIFWELELSEGGRSA